MLPNFLTNPPKQEENKYVYNLTSSSFQFTSFIHNNNTHDPKQRKRNHITWNTAD
jgi:hypothetical protein